MVMAKGVAKSQEAELERRKKISEARKRKMAEQGFLNSKETRSKIAKTQTGRICSKETRAKMSAAKKGVRPANFNDFLKAAHSSPNSTMNKRGEDHPWWRGDDIGYFGLHTWVNKVLGSPSECEHCGTQDAKKYEWANKSGDYKRTEDDWLRLCTSCHRKYDIENQIFYGKPKL